MKAKRILSLLLCIVMVAGMIPVGVNAADPVEVWNGGVDSTWYAASGDNFVIENAQQLAGLASLVNDGTSFEGKTVILKNNMDLNTIAGSMTWIAIGTTDKAFEGTFDGMNLGVKGLGRIYDKANAYYGLFGNIGSKGTVKKLNIVDCDINIPSTGGNPGTGAVAGVSQGTIDNCHVSGSVKGTVNVGGIVGNASGGNVKACSSRANVSGGWSVGGIAGDSNANIADCNSEGTVTGSNTGIGGVVGSADEGSLSNCFSTGNIVGIDDARKVGGVVGSTYVLVEKCYSTGNISGNDTIGGVAGQAFGNIQSCYSTGNITATKYDSGVAGGIAGYILNNTIQNCYASGSVSGPQNPGRLAGAAKLENVKYNYYKFIESDTTGAVGIKMGTGTVDNNFAKPAADFAEARMAWLLNTSDNTTSNSGIWAKGITPVFANSSDNLPVYRVILKNITAPAASEYYTEATGRISLAESPSDGTGKHFFGWFTDDKTFRNSFDISSVYNADKVLYANFGIRLITLSDYAASWSGDTIEYKGAVDDKGSGIAGASALTYIYYIDSSGKIKTTGANSGAASEGAAPVKPGTYYVQAVTASCPPMYTAKSNLAKHEITGGNIEPQISGVSLVSAGGTTAELNLSSNKAAACYYSVRPQGVAAPSASELKSSGTQVSISAGENSITLLGLAQTTKYAFYAVLYDGLGVASNVAKAEFATSSAWNGKADIAWYISDISKSTFRIADADDLAGLAALVNNYTVYYNTSGYVTDSTQPGAKPVTGTGFYSKTVLLSNGIDLAGSEWIPIGKSDSMTFQGIFDGCNNEIRGLTIKNGGEYSGLFGTTSGAGIKNLTLTDCDIDVGYNNVGGIAGSMGGTLEKCSVSGSIKGLENTGGIAGKLQYNPSCISACNSTADVNGSINTGGIVGFSYGKVEKCSSIGNTTGSGDYAGGIVGKTGYIVEDCYSIGNVAAASYAGGILGATDANGIMVKNCYSVGTVNGVKSGRIAGLVSSCIIENCFYNTITGDSTPATGEVRSGYIQKNTLPKTAEELESAKLAWQLNTTGGTAPNSGIWAQGGTPVFSDNSSHPAVYKGTMNNITTPEEKELYTDTEGRINPPANISDGTGKYFLGWYTDNTTFNIPFYTNEPLKEDTELYANFGKRIVYLSDYTASYTGSEIKYAGAVRDNTTGIPGVAELQYTYYMDNSGNEKTTNANSGAASEGGVPVLAKTYYINAATPGDPVNKIDSAVSNFAEFVISGDPVIKSISPVSGIDVAFGTAKAAALAALPATTNITDSDDAEHPVALSWEIMDYDGYSEGTYKATGKFTLPAGVIQATPALSLAVVADVMVGQPVNASLKVSWAVFELSAPEDVNAVINWGDATTVTSVEYESNSIVYMLNDDVLTISKEFLSGLGLQDGDTIQFVINYNYGESTTLLVETVETYIKSGDNKLKELKVNGKLVEDFAENRYYYTVKVPTGTAPGDPITEITAVTSHIRAVAQINPVTAIPGSGSVRVTAENGFYQDYNIFYEYRDPQQNWAPEINEDLPNPVTVGIRVNTPYTVDLSEIFIDYDDDPMTYKVSVNDGEFQATVSEYSFIPAEAGDTILKFVANDGFSDSHGIYTVTLKASAEQPANPYIAAIEQVDKVQVFLGCEEEDALDELWSQTEITDSLGNIYSVELSWTIKDYAANTVGDYEATGTFELPLGVEQSEPETPLAVKTVVSVIPLISAEISPQTVVFRLDDPEDVSTAINWGSAYRMSLVQKDISYYLDEDQDYTLTDNILTIKEAYLSNLQMELGDVEEFELEFNIGKNAVLKVEAVENYSPGSNAFLSDLRVSDMTVTDFVYNTFDYSVELPWDTLPESWACRINATAQDPKAQVKVTPVAKLPGIGIVEVTAEDGSTTQEYSISFKLKAAPNNAPKRKAGVSAAVSKSVTVNSTYTLVLSGIFEDADGDPLSYKVSVNGAAAVNAGENYSYRAGNVGITTLVFTANDGKTDSADTYTVTITASPKHDDTDKDDKDDKDGNGGRGGSGSIANDPVPVPKKPNEITIPVESLLAGAGQPVQLNAGFANLLLPSNMLTPGAAGSNKQATIAVDKADISKLPAELLVRIGNKPVIELAFMLDGKVAAWNNPDAPVTVSIPYKPTAEELKEPEHITIWYIDGSGNVVSVPNGRYDAAAGTVTFTTTHFSKYAVAYVKKSFSDLEAVAWAKKPIEVLASKGIMEGRTDSMFYPQVGITRAEYVAALVRTLGVKANTDTNFDDVAIGRKYYEEIAIAKKLGISKGSGNNRFNPEDTITRQDMLVLTERALRSLGKLNSTGAAADLERFTDRAEVRDYAIESIATLVKEGLAEGSGGRLNTKAETTRAEAAVFLYRLYNR